MVAGHVVVQSGLALVRALAQVALELRGLTRAAHIVVLHAPHTATLELTSLERVREEEEGRGEIIISVHSMCKSLDTTSFNQPPCT